MDRLGCKVFSLCLLPLYGLGCSPLYTQRIYSADSISTYPSDEGGVLSNDRSQSEKKTICVLPPPPAGRSYSRKGQTTIEIKNAVNVSGSGESTSTLAKVYDASDRTLFLQFSLYRLCEAQANGAIDKETYSQALRRESDGIFRAIKAVTDDKDAIEKSILETTKQREASIGKLAELTNKKKQITQNDKINDVIKDLGRLLAEVRKEKTPDLANFTTHTADAIFKEAANVENDISAIKMSIQSRHFTGAQNEIRALLGTLNEIVSRVKVTESSSALADQEKQESEKLTFLTTVLSNKNSDADLKRREADSINNTLISLNSYIQTMQNKEGYFISADRLDELNKIKVSGFWRGFDKVLDTAIQLAKIDVDKAKADADKAKADADKAKADADKAKADADKAKADADKAKSSADVTKSDGEKNKSANITFEVKSP